MEKLFGIPMHSLATFLLGTVGLILLMLFILGWRNRVMVRLGLRNIPRRRAQAVLIVVGLMLSTLIIAAAFGTGDTMTHSFRAIVLNELGEADELIYAGGERDFFLSPSEMVFFDEAHFQSLAGGIASRRVAADDLPALVAGGPHLPGRGVEVRVIRKA